jgi:hypothetical protein
VWWLLQRLNVEQVVSRGQHTTEHLCASVARLNLPFFAFASVDR